MFLYSLRDQFPKCRIYYLEGNHEARVSIFLLTHADALASLSELSLPSLLKLKELRIDYLPSDRILRIGNLVATHGHLLKGTCSQFPARSLYLATKTNAICGHAHRPTFYQCRSITGDVYKTYSTGCLSILNPSYSYFNDFCHGIATVETDNRNNFEVQLKAL